jgi:DNA-binding protein H-NS
MTTYRDVKAKIDQLQKQAAVLFKKETDSVIAKIHSLMEEYNLTPADLAAKGRGKLGKALMDAGNWVAATKSPVKATAKSTSKAAAVAKYQDPVSGKTWTGHGKAPGWMVEGLKKKGATKEDFRIGKPAAAQKAVEKKVAKPAKSATASKAVKPAVVPAAKKVAPAKPAKVAPKKSNASAKPAKATKKPLAKALVAKAAKSNAGKVIASQVSVAKKPAPKATRAKANVAPSVVASAPERST